MQIFPALEPMQALKGKELEGIYTSSWAGFSAKYLLLHRL